MKENPIFRIAVICAASALLVAWVLMPGSSEVWRRMALEREDQRLERKFYTQGAEVRKENPSLYAWVEHVLLPSRKPQAIDETKIKASLEGALQARESGIHFEATAKRIGQLLGSLSSKEAISWIESHSFPKEEWKLIHQGAVASILDQKEFSRLEVLEEKLFSRFEFTAQDALRWLDYWKWKSDAEWTLKAMQRYQDIASFSEEAQSPLLVFRIQLLRELNRNSEAFDQGLALMPKLRGLAGEADLMRQMTQCAEQGERLPDLLHAYAEWAERNPTSAEIWGTYVRIALAAGKIEEGRIALQHTIDVAGARPEHQFLMAQILEWTGKPDAAFDQYLLIARGGEAKAIPRLLALYPGLFREMEATQTLDQITPSKKDDPNLLILANLLTSVGLYPKAIKRFEEYLQFHPENQSAWLKLIDLYLLRMDLDSTLRVVKQGLHYHPDSLDLRKWKIQTLLYQTKFDEALAVMDEMVFRLHRLEVVDDYLAIAEITGKGRTKKEAIQAMDGNPISKESLLILSALGDQAVDLPKQTHWVEALLKQTPLDPELLLFAAKLYLQQDQSERALATLNKVSDWKSRNPKMGLEIVAASDTPANGMAAVNALSREIHESPELLRTAAGIYSKAGRFHEALSIYHQLQVESAEDIGLIAEYAMTASRAGQIQVSQQLLKKLEASNDLEHLRLAATVAEELGQSRNLMRVTDKLSMAPGATAQDWIDSGQRFESHGVPQRARRLYLEALQKLTKP